jgi:uncharacterized membrane protein
MDLNALEEIVLTVIHYLVPLVEACGAFVIVMGVIRTMAYQLRRLFSFDAECVANARLQLVQSLVMGLDFQVAADVLKTAIAPTWNDILLLAAVIGLRTVLNYLLERESHTLHGQTGHATGHESEPPLTEV